MKPQNYKERKEKWEEKSREHKANPSRQATFILTVKNTLELLGNGKGGNLLDVGCGFGEIDILLAQKTNFDIVGFDISEYAVSVARENVKRVGLENRIKIEEGDVYDLKYPDNSFDAVASFGYVSAATYPGVQKEIARVLKPGGILICDFINCLSIYKFSNSIKRIVQKRTPYYISSGGIRRKFEKEGLVYSGQRFFNTYPPLHFKIPSNVFLIFENTLGKIFRIFLARVRLVSFKKVKL